MINSAEGTRRSGAKFTRVPVNPVLPYTNNWDNKLDRNETHSSKLWWNGDHSVQCCKAKKNIGQYIKAKRPHGGYLCLRGGTVIFNSPVPEALRLGKGENLP